MDKPLWMWGLFLGAVVVLLAFDLGLFNRKAKEISASQSIKTYIVYVLLAFLHGAWVWHRMGLEAAELYLTAYLVEQSLAMDNIFIISLIFTSLAIPRHLQHRVLFWGIVSVIVLRGIMIGLGAALIAEYQWILYFFGAFLVFTGIKMLVVMEKEPDIENNVLMKWLRSHINITPQLHGEKFFIRAPHPKDPGRMARWATPLFVALVMIEFVDIIFAVDSIPAVFAITQDPYLVYTSNIFAILGLRTLYFALSAMIHRFRYLKYALAFVLIFIGVKIFLVGIIKIPASISLLVTFGLLAGGVLYSLYRTGKENEGKA